LLPRNARHLGACKFRASFRLPLFGAGKIPFFPYETGANFQLKISAKNIEKISPASAIDI
jgi:hypothetical protein